MQKEKIISRIRKLLNLAEDDSAFDGEVSAAMAAAARLMDEYHLSRADIDAAAQQESCGPTATPPPPPRMGKAETHSRFRRLALWELTLGTAINDLIGTTGWILTGIVEVPIGPFKRPSPRAGVEFYGPDEDAKLAAEMFAEWQAVIATIATGKYGRPDAGNGALYAWGFAHALWDKAKEANRHREEIVTPATTALVRVGENRSLAALNRQIREDALNWLEREKGYKIGKARGRRNGYKAGSYDAYLAGKADGQNADFTARRKAKLPG